MMISRILLVAFTMLLSPAAGLSQSVLPSADEQATTPVLADEDLTPEVVSDLVSRLSDQDVRDLLLQRLNAVAATNGADAEEGSIFTFLPSAAAGIGSAVAEAVRQLPRLWDSQVLSFQTFMADRTFQDVMRLLGTLMLAIAVGLVAEWLVNRIALRWREEIQGQPAPGNLGEALRLLGLRLLLDVIGLVVFALVARTVVTNVLPPDEIEIGRIVMINLIMVPRLMAALSRFLLAPTRPDLRIVHTDDETAKYVHRHWISLGILIGFMIFIVVFNEMNGVPAGSTRLGFWLNLAIHIYIIVIAIKARNGLAMMLMGPEEEATPAEKSVARAYPWFAVAVSVVTWLLVELLVSMERFDLLVGGRHYLTMGILLMAPAMDTMIRGLVGHILPAMTGEGAIAERAYVASKRCCIRVGRATVFGIVVLTIAFIWGLDFHNLASQGVGARAAAALIEFMLVLAVG
ncbi:MAG: mechanosensitive ion channel family protein, partial [Geminicoccaceae bacterium]